MKVKKPAAKSLLSFAFATLLPFMAGIFCALSMAPASWWPLLFAGFSLFYITLAKAGSAGRAALSGFFFGLGYFLKGLWWIGNALLVEGNDYAWVWPLAVMGLPTLLALFTSVAAALSRVTGDLKTISGFLVFCAVMALSEWVRGHIFTGFPWNLYAYAWSENLPLLQTLSLTGPYGLTLLTIFWAALGGYLYVSPQSLNRKMLLTFSAVFLFIACFSFGSYRLHTSADESTNRNIALRVIQPNIRQDLKWLPDLQGLHFEKHLKLSAPSSGEGAPQASTTLIIWPETSVPPVIFESPAGRDKIKNMLSSYKGEVYLLAGVLRREKGESGQTDYYNSIVLFDKKGRVRPLYDKTHLVPFGEYIPLQKWIPLRPVVEFTGFQRGAGPQTIIEDSIPPFSGLVCYEIIFPGKVAGESETRPDWIVNLTNDAWYGISAGPYQHFDHARFRAVEEALPVIRSANTGLSGVIDSYGRTLSVSTLNQDNALQTLLPAASGKATLYSQTRDWPFLLFCGFILLAGFRRMFKHN